MVNLLHHKFYLAMLIISIISLLLFIFVFGITICLIKERSYFTKFYLALIFTVCAHSVFYSFNWKIGNNKTLYGDLMCTFQGLFYVYTFYVEGSWVLLILILYYKEMNLLRNENISLTINNSLVLKPYLRYFTIGFGIPLIFCIIYYFWPGYGLRGDVCSVKKGSHNLIGEFLFYGIFGIMQIASLIYVIIILVFLRNFTNNKSIKGNNDEIFILKTYIFRFLVYPGILIARTIINTFLHFTKILILNRINEIIGNSIGIIYPLIFLWVTGLGSLFFKKLFNFKESDDAKFEMGEYANSESLGYETTIN